MDRTYFPTPDKDENHWQSKIDSQADMIAGIGNYAAGILSGSFAALDALRDQFSGDEAATEKIRELYRANLRMLRFLRRSQNYSERYGSAVLCNTDICDIVTRLAQKASAASAKKITITTDLPDEPVAAAVDASKLYYAMLYLLSDTVMRGFDDITLTVQTSQEIAELSITYSGASDSVEDNFEEIIANGVRNPGLLELGLMAASIIAADMGGTLEFVNDYSIRHFVFRFPLIVDEDILFESEQLEYRGRFGMTKVEFCDIAIEGFDY